jgi:aspartyl aminopeptidase
MVNTFGYGGGLWHTWFDRDLGMAGRAIVKTKDGGFVNKLVCINEPIARIPNLAIHLSSAEERAAFSPNLHSHCKAILSLDPDIVKMKPDFDDTDKVTNRLHPLLLKLVAKELNIDAADIVDLELQLIDTVPSCLGGANKEFIYSGRLDNLCSSYQCLRAIIDGADEFIASSKEVSMAFLFDHEEVGSNSSCGAGSSLFMDTLKLITNCLNNGNDHGILMRSLRKSFVVSIDMAHALHPNYTAKHDPSMAPKINGGLVIKTNCNQRYATTAVGATMFRKFGALANIPVQEFTVKADAGCGSTIGPIITTLSGILTVDCGSPQFSMHSIREMMGSKDVFHGYLHLKSVFEHHETLASRTDSEVR